MSKRSASTGVKARYFLADYSRPEFEAHFAFVTELIVRGVFQAGFGSYPNEDGSATLSFAIAEEVAEEYIAVIRSAAG